MCGEASWQVDGNFVCAHLCINPVRPQGLPKHSGRVVNVVRYPLCQFRVAVMSRPVLRLQVIGDGGSEDGKVRPVGWLVAEALRDQLPQVSIDVIELLMQEVAPVGPRFYPSCPVGVGDGN